MNYTETNNSYFEKSAARYDRNTRLISSWRRKLFEAARAETGNKIIDIATGTGAVAMVFASHGFDTTGIDLSPEMLSIAHSKTRNLPVKFLTADASALPFENKSFDIATVSFALHDMPLEIRKIAASEVYRILKPGGKFVVMDYFTPKNLLWKKISFAIINSYEELNYCEFVNSNLNELLNEPGFHIVSEKIFLCGVAKLTVCTK